MKLLKTTILIMFASTAVQAGQSSLSQLTGDYRLLRGTCENKITLNYQNSGNEKSCQTGASGSRLALTTSESQKTIACIDQKEYGFMKDYLTNYIYKAESKKTSSGVQVISKTGTKKLILPTKWISETTYTLAGSELTIVTNNKGEQTRTCVYKKM